MTEEQIKAEFACIKYAARIGDHEVAHRYEDSLFISVLMGIRDGKIAD